MHKRLSFFFILFLLSPNLWAKDGLESPKNQIERLETSLSEKDKQIKKALTQLKHLELEIAKSAKENYQLKIQLKEQTQALEQTRKEVAKLQEKHKEKRQALTAHIQVVEQLLHTHPLKIMFEQNISTYQRTLKSFKHLTAHQKQTILEMLKALDELQTKTTTFETRVQNIEKLKQEQQQKHENLLEQLQARQTLLATWQNEQAKYQKTLDLLKRDASVLESHRPQPKYSGKIDTRLFTHFSWPLKEQHKKRQQAHEQIANRYILATPTGQPVRAIYPGKVIFADWLRGFGLMMIIDHGQDYMSLYGHNQSLFKVLGDDVNQGETIALSGDSGGQREPGLYFEVRRKGKSINLERWFR